MLHTGRSELFNKNRCHPGVANSPLKGRARSSHLNFRILRVRTVWKTIQYRREEGETGAKGGPRRSVCARTRVYASEGVYATRAHIAPALANARRTTCVAHESAWKKEGCGQEDDGRESRWRRSLVQPSSILHKVRWEISINRFRRWTFDWRRSGSRAFKSATPWESPKSEPCKVIVISNQNGSFPPLNQLKEF